MSDQLSLWDTPNATSLPESEDGPTRSDSQAGPAIGPCGLDRAHANLTPAQALAAELTTRATYGGRSAGTSTSAGLQRSLESKLRGMMEASGLPEYAKILSEWDTNSGQLICALRLRDSLSGRACFGWPTPTATGNAGALSMRKWPAYRKLQDDLRGSGAQLEDWYRAAMGYPKEWG